MSQASKKYVNCSLKICLKSSMHKLSEYIGDNIIEPYSLSLILSVKTYRVYLRKARACHSLSHHWKEKLKTPLFKVKLNAHNWEVKLNAHYWQMKLKTHHWKVKLNEYNWKLKLINITGN